jgi:hypothetical protein
MSLSSDPKETLSPPEHWLSQDWPALDLLDIRVEHLESTLKTVLEDISHSQPSSHKWHRRASETPLQNGGQDWEQEVTVKEGFTGWWRGVICRLVSSSGTILYPDWCWPHKTIHELKFHSTICQKKMCAYVQRGEIQMKPVAQSTALVPRSGSWCGQWHHCYRRGYHWVGG